jgi:hypothetical protein
MLVVAGLRDESAGRVTLEGRTSKGLPLKLELDDGKLVLFATRASVLCPEQGVWTDWGWFAENGDPGVHFRQDGRRFRVRERTVLRRADRPATLVGELRGEVGGDGRVASGTVAGRRLSGRGADSSVCEGEVSFVAREAG